MTIKEQRELDKIRKSMKRASRDGLTLTDRDYKYFDGNRQKYTMTGNLRMIKYLRHSQDYKQLMFGVVYNGKALAIFMRKQTVTEVPF